MRTFKRRTLILVLGLLALTVMSCGLMEIFDEVVAEATQIIEEQTRTSAATLEAEKGLPTASVTPTQGTPQPATGGISGSLGFPSEYIPPMRVVAFDTNSADYYYVETELNQTHYQLADLPAGTYQVVAYVRDQGPDMGGGYSAFVTCGMTMACTDHTLLDVFVTAGEVTPDVDPVDFYAIPGEMGWPVDPVD